MTLDKFANGDNVWIKFRTTDGKVHTDPVRFISADTDVVRFQVIGDDVSWRVDTKNVLGILHNRDPFLKEVDKI